MELISQTNAMKHLPARSPETTTLAHKGWRAAAITAWIIIASFNMILYLIAIPSGFNAHLEKAADLYAASLGSLGLSPHFYAGFRSILDGFLAAAFTLTGVVVFIKKPSDWMVSLVSITLITFGGLFVPTLVRLTGDHPEWSLPVGLLRGIGLATSLVVFYFLFPNGRFTPAWTRWIALAWTLAALVWVIFPGVPMNLVHIDTWAGNLGPSIALFFLAYGAGIAAQIYRYRFVSTPGQRQQTKWVVVGTTLAVAGFLLYYLPLLLVPALQEGTHERLVSSFVTIPIYYLMILSAPLFIAFSILRYRLWDIGLIVNRSLVYAALTLSLVVLYSASVLVFTNIVGVAGGTNQTEIATVISTLLISAAIIPLRNRLQNLIDRRFYRRHYDIAKTLSTFSTLVRSEVDMDRLSDRLVEVVNETMQPQNVTLWLGRKPVSVRGRSDKQPDAQIL